MLNMEKKAMKLDFLSAAGPYSHIVEAGDFYFLSGQLPVDIEKNIREMDDVKKATGVCLGNIKRALETVGSNMNKVVKTTVFLRDMGAFNDMNEVFKVYFPSDPPARTCVAVKTIPGDFPIEIEVVALR
jgi:2-iminobutanoate/2-iminopropanoate deaminase